MLTSIILVKTQESEIDRVVQGLVMLPGVAEVYSVSGKFDLVVIAKVNNGEELVSLVTEQMQSVYGIARTQTMIAFECYTRDDMAAMYAVKM